MNSAKGPLNVSFHSECKLGTLSTFQNKVISSLTDLKPKIISIFISMLLLAIPFLD